MPSTPTSLRADLDGLSRYWEVGGLAADQQTQPWLRFRGSDGLLRAVQLWLVGGPDDEKRPE
jgi:hypothetical protein